MSNEHLKIYVSYMKTIVWMSRYYDESFLLIKYLSDENRSRTGNVESVIYIVI